MSVVARAVFGTALLLSGLYIQETWQRIGIPLSRMLAAVRWPGIYVFPGGLGGHISVTTINNWVEALGREAGLGHLHPHQLRHTAGAHINDSRNDIHAAQEWLGHARVETTQVYTRMTKKRLLESMRTMDVWEDDVAA